MDNRTKIVEFLQKPIDATVCVLFSYHRIHDFITVIEDPIALELVLNSLIVIISKKYKFVRTLPTNWESYTPPVNRHIKNDGWHYNEEWMFHNALAEHCMFRFFKPMEEVFHIYANHPYLLLMKGSFFKNKTYASMIRFFDYIDVTNKKCPDFLVSCYKYYKRVRVYSRKYNHILNLFFLRKNLPNELNDMIMTYL